MRTKFSKEIYASLFREEFPPKHCPVDRTTEGHFFRKYQGYIITEFAACSRISFPNVDPTGSVEDSPAIIQHLQANASILTPPPYILVYDAAIARPFFIPTLEKHLIKRKNESYLYLNCAFVP